MRPIVWIASDHAGFDFKNQVVQHLTKIAEVRDLGPQSNDRVDYPDFADKLAREILKNPEARGILICGSGQGMAMRANKFSGIRAALCWDKITARLSREHNDANVLCLGGRMLPITLATEIIDIFLNTKFEGGRHSARVEKISLRTD